MASIAGIKPWFTQTPGENLFLFAYELVFSTVSVIDVNQPWVYSTTGINEFTRLTVTMELVHRCMNSGVALLSTNPTLPVSRIESELRNTLQVAARHGNLRKLAELTRLASIAYIERKLPDGLANDTHKKSRPNCCWCGRPTSRAKNAPKGERSTVEHLWPEFLGGESAPYNLTIACDACNSARQHAFNWAWFAIQAISEKLDDNGSLPKQIKLAIGLHRLMKVASGQTRYSKEVITLKEAAERLKVVIPEIKLVKNQRYTFLEILEYSLD
ncbi:MAG TPA: HNH endonuclease [Noviherbaspirillum sp.]|jgi:5-methylcytosine-specific restriction endonuclease McrA|uniref:HNH endonuclease n=1 Tax=Noviherbaspirillum sp. TaxID=1926288 RepID=UPI002DDD474C|nr:HNH endonuclease [Noviherbaspirillum sp.]HEV2610163.1 HNH endonuclease [Noviherbaspirillum sp.]